MAEVITPFVGGGQANATAITDTLTMIAPAANRDDSVLLPPALAGADHTVWVTGSKNIALWPSAGDQVGHVAVNGYKELAPNSLARFVCFQDGAWVMGIWQVIF